MDSVVSKMRQLLFVIVYPLIWVISRVFTYNLCSSTTKIRNYLYTLWIKAFLDNMGDSSIIQYPCSLQGGGSKRISIGNHTCIQSHCILGCWLRYGDNQHFSPTITIGDHCCIGEYTQITACNKISIGDGLLTGRYVYIGDNAHGGLSVEEANVRPTRRKLVSKGEILIGKNVWIGDKVTILGGVTIGDNVIVGANSVVTHDIPKDCLAVGQPAHVVKNLSSDI